MKKYQIPNNLISRTTKAYKVIKIFVLLVLSLFVIGSVLYTGTKIYGYFEDRIFSFQSPIILRNPLIIKLREAQAQKVESIVKPKQAPLKPKKTSYLTYPENFERAYDTVWFQESNRGKDLTGLNGTCIAKNLLNEIGYAVHEGYCFKDRTEQKETFMLWMKNRYGIPCAKVGACRATIGDLLSLYSSNAYSALLVQK